MFGKWLVVLFNVEGSYNELKNNIFKYNVRGLE